MTYYLNGKSLMRDDIFIVDPARVEIHKTARVDAWVKLSGKVTIHEHVHIASFCHIGAGSGEVIFGAHSGCASGVVIASGMPDLDYLHICPNEAPDLVHSLRKKTIIGEFVVIFANAVILPGVMIGRGAIVGAGSVVRHDVQSWDIVAGNPAKKIGEREQARQEWEQTLMVEEVSLTDEIRLANLVRRELAAALMEALA